MTSIEQLTNSLSLPGARGPMRQESLESLGSWRLDTARMLLCGPNQELVMLTGAETLLMEALLQARGAIVSRAFLAERLHGNFNGRATRRLDSLLCRLRTKVKRETGIPLPLATFRNIGFAFDYATPGDEQPS